MLIPRTVLRASVIAFALAAQAASAQTPLPKVWPEYYPRGQALADDAVFTRMINYDMFEAAVSWHQREWGGTGTAPCGSPPGAYLRVENPNWDSGGGDTPTNPQYLPDSHNYNPEAVAGRIALEAIWRGRTRSETDTTPDPKVAVFIKRFGMPVDVRDASAPHDQVLTTHGTFGLLDLDPMPDLYTNQLDGIWVTRTRITGAPSFLFRTPWMSHGIASTKPWMQRFVNAYQTYTLPCNTTTYRAAIPSRFVFDQEPALPLEGSPIGRLAGFSFTTDLTDNEKAILWQDMCDYWNTLKFNGRFGSSDDDTSVSYLHEPVPGCGGKTLWQLWRDAGFPEPESAISDAPPHDAQYDPQYPYRGETAANQQWYSWFCSVCHRALIGAMDETAFQVIHAKWPTCMSSDYDGSMRTSTFLERWSPGALGGPTGISYPVEPIFGFDRDPNDPVLEDQITTSPMEAGVLNALHFYSDVSSYHWLKWRQDSWYYHLYSSPTPLQRWGNTGGQNEYTYLLQGDGWQAPLTTGDSYAHAGDEFWEATSLRVNAFELANCFKANLPASDYDTATGMAAWITLPYQPIDNFSLPTAQTYNGLTYGGIPHMPMRQSAYSLYRTVADCRMHGVNEFMVWNNTGQDADNNATWDYDAHPEGPWGAYEGYYAHGGLHADREATWNILKQVMHQVYAYDCTVADKRGNYDSTAMAYSSSSPHFVERLRYADQGDANTDAHRAVKVVPVDNVIGNTARIQLKFTPNGDIDTSGDCINFEVRLRTDIPASVKVELQEVSKDGDGVFQSTWRTLGATGQPIANDLDKKNFNQFVIETNTDFRTIRFRLPRYPVSTSSDDPSLVDDRTDSNVTPPITASHIVNIRITGILTSETTPRSPAITIDNAICYISDTHYRGSYSTEHPNGLLTSTQFNHPADLNADGVVNSKDNDTFNWMSSHSDAIYRYFIDYNHDGAIDGTDQAVWSNTTNGLYYRDPTLTLDAHRYSMIDLDWATSSVPTSTTPTCPADVGIQGGSAGHDGQLDNNDFIAFITLFFNQDTRADLGTAGGVSGHDGVWDNNDFIAFINDFFNGCSG